MGLTLKQAEVHGMSQRGGNVQSNLRLSDAPISSDLITLGAADMILSLEPMEALRYLPYLSAEGIGTNLYGCWSKYPNYPDEEALMAELNSQPHVVALDIEKLAKENQMPKSGNVILFRATTPEDFRCFPLRESVGRIFASKGEVVVEMNNQAFDFGYDFVKRLNFSGL